MNSIIHYILYYIIHYIAGGYSFLKDKQLAQDVQVVDAGKKPVEAESREQIFASNLLSILRKDPKRATLRTELVGRSRAQASLADITKIMEEFRNKKLMQGFTGSEEEMFKFFKTEKELHNYIKVHPTIEVIRYSKSTSDFSN